MKKTFRRELTRIMIITSVITLLVIGGSLSAIVFRWTSSKAIEDIEFYMQNVQEQFAEKLLFLEEKVFSLQEKQEIIDFLELKTADEEAIKKIIENKMNLYADSNLIESEYPIIKDFYLFNKEKQGVGTHFYPMTQSDDKFMKWHLKNELTIYLTQDIVFYYQKNGSELDCIFPVYDDDLCAIGYCCTVFDLKSIERIYGQLEKYEEYYWTFETTDNRMLGGTGIPTKETDVFDSLNGKIRLNGKEYFYAIKKNSFGLNSYVLIPKGKMYLTIKPIFQILCISALSLFVALFVVIRKFGQQITVPMQQLVEKLNQFGAGDLETRIDEYEIMELQQISDSFNSMAVKIEQLIKEIYETKLIAQEMKMQYLQAQINPHFFFNVLSAIAIRLKMNQEEELYQMVNAFAGLMQGKLFRKNEIEILAEKEVEIVGFYLYLQGERFKDIITYEIIWESEELKKCYIPRLSIEPLVENAVIHGLEPKGEEGSISVRIRRDADIFEVLVTDDGVGFDTEEYMNTEEERNPRVGIMNIRRLIHNLYGKEYDLSYKSTPGKGTTVILRIPFHTERKC